VQNGLVEEADVRLQEIDAEHLVNEAVRLGLLVRQLLRLGQRYGHLASDLGEVLDRQNVDCREDVLDEVVGSEPVEVRVEKLKRQLDAQDASDNDHVVLHAADARQPLLSSQHLGFVVGDVGAVHLLLLRRSPEERPLLLPRQRLDRLQLLALVTHPPATRPQSQGKLKLSMAANVRIVMNIITKYN
jgi:hypothetical protein